MINYPIVYHRDFKLTFPPALATVLPLAALYRPFQKPLTLLTSSFRAVTSLQDRDLLQTALSASAVALTLLHPSRGLLAATCSDFLDHLRALDLPALTLDLLVLATIGYGSIELTVACLTVQILLEATAALRASSQGRYLEALVNTLLTAVHTSRLLPQTRLLHWKYTRHPICEATLKQTPNGFAYLDIPDSYLSELLPLLQDPEATLPPYFKPGMVGAHISVVFPPEHASLLPLGQKVPFRIVHIDTTPTQVSFVTVASPALEAIRIQAGLPARIHDHDFHLTFAVKPA